MISCTRYSDTNMVLDQREKARFNRETSGCHERPKSKNVSGSAQINICTGKCYPFRSKRLLSAEICQGKNPARHRGGGAFTHPDTSDEWHDRRQSKVIHYGDVVAIKNLELMHTAVYTYDA